MAAKATLALVLMLCCASAALAWDYKSCKYDNDCKTSNVCIKYKCSYGQCVYSNQKDQYPCNDGNACTLNDYCYKGQCKAGKAKYCPDKYQCKYYTGCNKKSGECQYALRPYGYKCDDGDKHTNNDQCDHKGNCKGTPYYG